MNNLIPISDTPEIREQITRIMASSPLRRSLRGRSLFNYLSEQTMAGRASELTQSKIAIHVFGADNPNDQRSGAMVRIAMVRLRDALREYYLRKAQPDELRIHVPPREYCVSVEQIKRLPKADHPPDAAFQKKISDSDMIGESGVNFIQQLCLKMGYVWYPTRLEAGIDGYIEIRGENGEVTNCIIQVQSKATERAFEAETESTFEFRCAAKDLDYWLAGNAPVILIRSRPKTGEAYWVSLKDYFSDLTRRKTGKIIFNKLSDRFDVEAKLALRKLATLRDSGLYLGTHPKRETVYSNLLQVGQLPKHYFVAATEYRTRAELFATLHEFFRSAPGEWILNGKMLTSFHDLTKQPWTQVCERGTVEQLDTEEWAETDNSVRQKELTQLLNACLREKVYRKGIRFSREHQFYYFRASQDLSEREYVYQSREHKTSRVVFKGYPRKGDHTVMAYYRHSAFEGHFVRYGQIWYLQITPTYYFTRDGERLYRYAPDLLSGIKRLENNQAVHGQVVMWAHLLTERNLFDSDNQFLNFSSLLEFEINAGLDDDAWIKREETDKYLALQTFAIDDRQPSLIL